MVAACSDSDSNPSSATLPPPGPFTPTNIGRADDAPGVIVEILATGGGSGVDGSFEVGDRPVVTFTVEKRDGSSWQLAEFSSGGIMVSGPTFNYQRVIPDPRDVITRALPNPDGSYSYTFANGIPDVYAPPINDTSSFGELDGELAGQPLLAGTYTVGLYLSWNYTVEGDSFRDAGDAAKDFLFGGASNLVAREVVRQENCNQCHQSLRAHGGSRRSARLCVLCHTSGAEDRNSASVGNGTPGASVDFRVMIHKIHNGARLPSVLGVGTNPDGSRNYSVTPQPYHLAGSRLHEYSEINFPVFPNLVVPMPRDADYSALSSTNRALEDTIRSGAAECAACHGDPDGTGPLPAPAQGLVAFAQPTRRACGSCHDDVDWTHPYTSNNETMPAQLHDSACVLCHRTGNALDAQVAHTHPLKDPNFNPGLEVVVTALVEAGSHNSSGTIDPGEKIATTFRLLNDEGVEVAPASLASLSVVVAGPTTNSNILLNTSIPTVALTGTQPFTVNLPETLPLEYLGNSTAVPGETFATRRAPHWNVTGALTSLWVRKAAVLDPYLGNSVLAVAAAPPGNFIDVASARGFARNDYIVIDDGVPGRVEYLQIQSVIGNRLWFSSPASNTYAVGLRTSHPAGATVLRVELTPRTRGTHYSLDAATGTITELQEFGAGSAVIVTYTTDFVMPSAFPLALNDVPDLDETSGRWAGKPVGDGTYAMTLWGSRNLTLNLHGESNSYRSTSPGVRREFLVGAATELQPYGLIDSAQACYSCHKEIGFHGYGRRGFDTCIACHGTAGAGDRPQYVAPNAPATDGVTVNFRTMLHKIHMGKDLTNASTYLVNGFGSTSYPNNFTSHSYAEVGFPSMPGGVANCTQCHGATNEAWLQPVNRDHPTAQGRPVRSWKAVCGACHDASSAAAHIDVQTSAAGVESCEVCHGTNRDWHVKLMHKTR